jgi:hypothetical protein
VQRKALSAACCDKLRGLIVVSDEIGGFSAVTIKRCPEERSFTLVELLTVAAILEHRLLYYIFLKDNRNFLYLHFLLLFPQEFLF